MGELLSVVGMYPFVKRGSLQVTTAYRVFKVACRAEWTGLMSLLCHGSSDPTCARLSAP